MVGDYSQRQQFDVLLEKAIQRLPREIAACLDEIPVIVDDEPSEACWVDLDLDPQSVELCGLHTGVPLGHRSVEMACRLPDEIRLFRGPIIRVSQAQKRSGAKVSKGGAKRLERQIKITLLHEIGHHFGLDEEQLAELGYG